MDAPAAQVASGAPSAATPESCQSRAAEEGGQVPETAERQRRPRGAGSIQWKGGRPYAVYRDVLTGKQTWTGFDTEEQADAFLAQWAADKKAARVAAKAAAADR
jgi:hypothetical protein